MFELVHFTEEILVHLTRKQRVELLEIMESQKKLIERTMYILRKVGRISDIENNKKRCNHKLHEPKNSKKRT